MKHGLGKILATHKLPQMESLGVTDATRFIEVYQVLLTDTDIVVINKKGKVVRRVDISDQRKKVTAVRETVRGLVTSFKETHSLKAILGGADKGLLIEVVTSDTSDFSSVGKETITVDFVVTTITEEESKELTKATRHDEPLLEHNSIGYWRKEKYGSLGKYGLLGVTTLASLAVLLLTVSSMSLILITIFMLVPASVLFYDLITYNNNINKTNPGI
jgi:hypothetical protein